MSTYKVVFSLSILRELIQNFIYMKSYVSSLSQTKFGTCKEAIFKFSFTTPNHYTWKPASYWCFLTIPLLVLGKHFRSSLPEILHHGFLWHWFLFLIPVEIRMCHLFSNLHRGLEYSATWWNLCLITTLRVKSFNETLKHSISLAS